uniref:Uncharacterized protein n=1 Tax=Glossina palpalis gambiensis TaxID=67801 RepID=A0A1B0AW73_9MUSC
MTNELNKRLFEATIPRHNKGFYGVMVSTLDFESSDPSRISMDKIKVKHYTSSRRPDYAKDYSHSEVSDLDAFLDSRLLTTTSQHGKPHSKHDRNSKKQTSEQDKVAEEINDPRLRRSRA